MSRVRTEWRGDDVRRRLRNAVRDGINITLGEAVVHAKRNHPGWGNRTGTAEGSVRIVKPASTDGDRISGLWGSTGVGYVIFLEFLRGRFLQSAADATYPQLEDHIRDRLR